MCPGGDLDGWFAKLAPDGQAELDEATWLQNIKHIPELLAALTQAGRATLLCELRFLLKANALR